MTPEDRAEAEYALAEREGLAIDSAVCPECPAPATCYRTGPCGPHTAFLPRACARAGDSTGNDDAAPQGGREGA